MYRRIADFLNDHASETESTLKLLRAIPETAARETIKGGRSLGRLAWHVTCSPGEIAKSAGLGALEPHDDQKGDVPPVAKNVAAYEKSAKAFGEMVKKAWNDKMLDEEIEMYGMKLKRGQALTMLIVHQAHHRGQMTVLMRQAGIALPGIMGPSKEEWAQMNMPAQK